jgi:hypothetical protein
LRDHDHFLPLSGLREQALRHCSFSGEELYSLFHLEFEHCFNFAVLQNKALWPGLERQQEHILELVFENSRREAVHEYPAPQRHQVPERDVEPQFLPDLPGACGRCALSRCIVTANAHIEQFWRDLFLLGPLLEQGEIPSLVAVENEAVERAVPYRARVGIVPADPGAGLPAGAIEDIELFQGDLLSRHIRRARRSNGMASGNIIKETLLRDNRRKVRYNNEEHAAGALRASPAALLHER